MIVLVILVLLFVLLGFLFRSGRGAFLIAGYNTASKAERDKIDEKKLCRYMGNLMFALAGCQLFFIFSVIFEKMWLLWVALALFLVCVFGGVIYINTGNRIKK